MHPRSLLCGRRTLLQTGLGLGLGLGTAGVAGTILLPPEAHALDWSSLLGKKMPDVSGKVVALTGAAFADDQPLKVGSAVPSGARVRVVSGGRAAIALEDGSIFTVSGGTTLELLLNRMSEGILNLLAGALLLAVNSGGRYLVAGSTASFGIKGTVMYRQVFGPQDGMARAMDGMVRIPAGVRDYECTCHGTVDFVAAKGSTPRYTAHADYHEAYYLDPADPSRRIHAPMLNHGDDEIRKLVALQPPGKRHDTSWLRH